MIALKRILAPHDFSETSEAAVTYATGLAEGFQATLDVLHVVPESGDYDAGSTEAAQQRLMKNVVLHENRRLDVKFHVCSGTPDVEITRFARACDVDLIVMGTHGRGLLGHALMGSVSEKVVRTASCPVLTVRRPQRESVVPRVLVALDFEPASDTALTYGRALARAFGATLHVLHVTENYFLRPVVSDSYALMARARNRVWERITDEDCAALHATVAVEVSDAPADAIVDYATGSGIDLIVIGTHGRKGTTRLLMGSVAERIVRTAPCPVLTVRSPEHEFVRPDGTESATSTVRDEVNRGEGSHR